MAVEVLPLLDEGGSRYSSSRIRQALAEADLVEAERLLQRPYRFSGQVVRAAAWGAAWAGPPPICKWMAASACPKKGCMPPGPGAVKASRRCLR